jgi:hypothetical protein
MAGFYQELVAIVALIGVSSVGYADKKLSCHDFSGSYTILAGSCVATDQLFSIPLTVATGDEYKRESFGLDEVMEIRQSGCRAAQLRLSSPGNTRERVYTVDNEPKGPLHSGELVIDQQHFMSSSSLMEKDITAGARWALLFDHDTYYFHAKVWSSHLFVDTGEGPESWSISCKLRKGP